MIPDHARALRTSAALATLAILPSIFLTLALGMRQEWIAFSASFFATMVLFGIGFRCAFAYDRLRSRLRPGPLRSILVIGCALASYPAAAQQAETLARAGVWNAFVAMGERGATICGMDTAWPDGRHFMVKRIGGHRHLTLHVTRSTWRIPPGTRITASMAIGSAPPFTGTGTAVGNGRTIEWTLAGAEIAAFERAFRAASLMRLTFSSGDEPAWTISLRGTNAMADAFVQCIRAQDAVARAPTQPFDASPTAPAAPAEPAVAPRGRERRT